DVRRRCDELQDPRRIVSVQLEQARVGRRFARWPIVKPPRLSLGRRERAEERALAEDHLIDLGPERQPGNAREAAEVHEARELGTGAVGKTRRARLRTQSVASDQQVCLEPRAIGETCFEARRALLDAGELVPEVDGDSLTL